MILSRERPVLVEPRGAGLVMSTLRSADEVRPASHDHKATEQTPTMANALAATAALRNHIRRLAKPRWFCIAACGLDATELALIA